MDRAGRGLFVISESTFSGFKENPSIARQCNYIVRSAAVFDQYFREPTIHII